MKFAVDEVTLTKSRRCPESICAFVRAKLGINIESTGMNKGEVKWVTTDIIHSVLMNPSILKHVFSDAASYSFRAMNWSYSKGDTVETACVILTERFEEIDTVGFSVPDIPVSTVNKLYVALTRSKGDLLLIKASDFKKYKDGYKIAKA